MNQRGYAPILLILGVLITVIIVGGVYLFKNTSLIKTTPKACTQEAKICSDGSAVGRASPNCEFTQCPQVTPTKSADETANWKTYTNTKYSYSVKYPDSWTVSEMPNDFTSNSVTLSQVKFNFEKNNDIPNVQVTVWKANSLRHAAGEIKISLDGDTAWEGGSEGPRGIFHDTVFTDRNGFGYSIKLEYEDNSTSKAWQKKIFDQIVSTFKFVSSTPGPITNDCFKMCPNGKAVECRDECTQ